MTDDLDVPNAAELVRLIETESGMPVERAVYACEEFDPLGFAGFPVLSPEAKALADRLGVASHEMTADQFAAVVLVALQDRVSLVEALARGVAFSRETVTDIRQGFDDQMAEAAEATQH